MILFTVKIMFVHITNNRLNGTERVRKEPNQRKAAPHDSTVSYRKEEPVLCGFSRHVEMRLYGILSGERKRMVL